MVYLYIYYFRRFISPASHPGSRLMFSLFLWFNGLWNYDSKTPTTTTTAIPMAMANGNGNGNGSHLKTRKSTHTQCLLRLANIKRKFLAFFLEKNVENKNSIICHMKRSLTDWWSVASKVAPFFVVVLVTDPLNPPTSWPQFPAAVSIDVL